MEAFIIKFPTAITENEAGFACWQWFYCNQILEKMSKSSNILIRIKEIIKIYAPLLGSHSYNSIEFGSAGIVSFPERFGYKTVCFKTTGTVVLTL